MIIDKSNEANKPVKDNKPLLKIKSDGSVAEDMYPKTSTFTIKIIAARGMGQTIFLIAFLHSLINRGIVCIFCATFNEQDQWRSFIFMERNFKYLNEKYVKRKLLVFDDMQLDTKGNELIETLLIRDRHNKTRIKQCEQFTQTSAHIEKEKTGFFGLISPFNESAAQYYRERFMQTLAARIIWKLGLLAEEKETKEDNTELRYLIMN